MYTYIHVYIYTIQLEEALDGIHAEPVAIVVKAMDRHLPTPLGVRACRAV